MNKNTTIGHTKTYKTLVGVLGGIMKLNKVSSVFNNSRNKNRNLAIFGTALTALLAMPTIAEESTNKTAEEKIEVIEITGIRSSLTSALAEKRNANNLVEVINAVDIGKLPDQNLAEVLENITGVQITRTAGVGTGVQIRGSNANIVQLNGAPTVGTGDGRSGMKFEDLSAGIIAGVEVTKAPTAKTIEGSVGGTINLRTIRPLELSEQLANIRVQGEDSSLTTDGVMPRLSGAFGNNWKTDAGKFGFVISGAFSRQEATSFRPRVDRDGSLVENINADVIRLDKQGNPVTEDQATKRPAAQAFDFLGIQFLNQETENFEYETSNIASTFEFAPNDDMKFFLDVVVTDQEVRQESTRVQGSGVSSVLNYNLPTEFETINFGSLGGQNLGTIQGAVRGSVIPNLGVDDDDPNLRFNSDTGARETDSTVFRLGGEWQATSNFFISAEIASAKSDTKTPKLDTQLNFINPNVNTPLDKLDDNGNITSSTSNDNSVPFIYDLTGNALTFGIDFDSMYAPTVDQLLDPNNVVLDQVDFSLGNTENEDNSLRIDTSYFFDDSIITSIDAGLRFSSVKHESISVTDRIGGFSKMLDSPGGSLFSDLLIKGPSNFGDADGRALALRNYLIINPDLAYSNPQRVIDTLHGAMEAHRANMIAQGVSDFLDGDGNYKELDYLDQIPDATAGFKVEEDTTALYLQANFEWEMIRGNFGVRYVDTEVESTGNTQINGVVSEVVTKGDYDYWLPRFNLIADVTDDVVVRMSWAEEIRRPSFGNLNTSVSYGTNENSAVSIGNPGLQPEEVESFDISADWYFAEAAVASIGYFKKDISNLFVQGTNSAEVFANGFRDTDPNCPGGGIFNPAVQPNILGDPAREGLCVDSDTSLNDPATVTQSGIEMAFQYDLSSFEDQLGWASGFGIQANYTIQEYKGGSVENTSATRGTDIFNAINGIYDIQDFQSVNAVEGLLDFSENAYNITVFYEKYGISARLRYTWREAFRTDDTAAGASRNSTLGFPVVTHDRGQLNASINYDVNDQLNIGLEAINLTEEEVTQSCVNEGAMLCFQGLADRRITLGASYRF